MNHIKLFENFMIKESMEMSSLAKQIVTFLQKNGAQVDLQFSKRGEEKNLNFSRQTLGGGLSGQSPKIMTFKNGEKVEKNSNKSQADFTVFCEINEENPWASKLNIRLRPINNASEATFVSDFVKNLKNYMNQKPVDKSGKPLGKSFSETLKIESQFGWDLDNVYEKIMGIIKKDGYFSPGMNAILTIKQINTGSGKSSSQFTASHDKIEGLKKGKVDDKGNYKMYGSKWLLTGREEDKKGSYGSEGVNILNVNEKDKKVKLNVDPADYSKEEETRNKIVDLAKRVAKKLGYQYIKSYYWEK